MTTLSSRQLNQHLNLAKKAAQHGPVIITDRGKPAHVLLRYEDYQRLAGNHQKIADLLAMKAQADADFELELPTSRDLPRPAELS